MMSLRLLSAWRIEEDWMTPEVSTRMLVSSREYPTELQGSEDECVLDDQHFAAVFSNGWAVTLANSVTGSAL
jgi:hypothetical protein